MILTDLPYNWYEGRTCMGEMLVSFLYTPSIKYYFNIIYLLFAFFPIAFVKVQL